MAGVGDGGVASGSAGAGPVRQFALALYRRPGVADACLDLQGRHDLDVNVVLFAAFVGAVRRHGLTGSDLSLVHARVGAWHREVIRPLRAVRQRLRSGPAPAPDEATTALRRKLAQLEIEAELIELGQLDALTAQLPPPGSTASATAAAETTAAAAIKAVITAHTGTALGPADRQAVDTIAAQAHRVAADAKPPAR